LLLISGLLSFTLPETSDQKLPQSLEEAEAFGKYWWKNLFKLNAEKSVFL